MKYNNYLLLHFKVLVEMVSSDDWLNVLTKKQTMLSLTSTVHQQHQQQLFYHHNDPQRWNYVESRAAKNASLVSGVPGPLATLSAVGWPIGVVNELDVEIVNK